MRRSGTVAVGSPTMRAALVLALVGMLLASIAGLLVAGGATPLPVRTADRGTFAATGDMGAVREAATATRLADGRVLVVGGYPDFGSDFGGPEESQVVEGGMGSSEIWDPATGAFTPSGALLHARWGHAAALLPDGRVLVVGGRTYVPEVAPDDGSVSRTNDSPREAELWDPATGAFEPAGLLAEGLEPAAAWPGRDGRVWVVGIPYSPDGPGQDADGRWLGAWVARSWSPTSMTFADATLEAAADKIPGSSMPGDRQLWVDGRLALVWDPATQSVGQLETLPADATKTLLPDGRVLVAGGAGGAQVGGRRDPEWCGPDAQLWDPATATGTPTGPLGIPRGRQAAALLDDGRVLVVGNFYTCDQPFSAEIFELR